MFIENTSPLLNPATGCPVGILLYMCLARKNGENRHISKKYSNIYNPVVKKGNI